MKKRSFPTAPTILLIICALAALMTYFIPAGTYDTLSYDSEAKTLLLNREGTTTSLNASQSTLDSLNVKIPIEKFTSGAIYKPINVPNTYDGQDPNPQGVAAFLKAPVKGVIESADIIFLVLFIGGLIGIMNKTGAFDSGIAWIAEKLKGHEYVLIILVTTLIAIGGTTFGLAEETMAFYPILIPVFLAAGYDGMVGLASIYIGSSVGTMCSTINPFSVIIASDAAGIEWTTGLEGRLIMWALCLTLCIIYILRYAKKVKKDPSKSIVFDQKEALEARFVGKAVEHVPELTNRIKLILFIFTATFIVMIVGVSMLDWWFVEMTATFMVGAILIGIVGKIKEGDFVESFSEGAGELLGVAFIIGIARGVSIIMDDGLISDTLLYHASTVTDGMNKGLFASVMFVLYNGLSFFIPSSSGMAVLTMPIMAPLADGVGVGREIIVNTYQYGMGLFAFINPTSLILAALAVVKIGFNKWLKFVWPLVIWLAVVTVVFLTVLVYV